MNQNVAQPNLNHAKNILCIKISFHQSLNPIATIPYVLCVKIYLAVHICHAFLTVSGTKKERAHAAMVNIC